MRGVGAFEGKLEKTREGRKKKRGREREKEQEEGVEGGEEREVKKPVDERKPQGRSGEVAG